MREWGSSVGVGGCLINLSLRDESEKVKLKTKEEMEERRDLTLGHVVGRGQFSALQRMVHSEQETSVVV